MTGAAARGLFLVSLLGGGLLGVFGWRQDVRAEPRVAPECAGDRFAATVPTLRPPATARWMPPGAQSRGREWIFEIFTPPLLYVDPATSAFTVRPPLAPEAVPDFGLRLKGIEDVPYRLRYRGHAGTEGHYFVELQDLEHNRFYRARPGETIEELGVRLVRFVAHQAYRVPAEPGATPFLDRTIELTLEDARRDALVILTDEPLFEPEPVAVLVDASGTEELRGRAGTTVVLGGAEYHIDSIDRANGRVVVTRSSRLDASAPPDTRSLQLPPVEPAPPPP